MSTQTTDRTTTDDHKTTERLAFALLSTPCLQDMEIVSNEWRVDFDKVAFIEAEGTAVERALVTLAMDLLTEQTPLTDAVVIGAALGNHIAAAMSHAGV
jgi:hypothetical protein